MPSAAHEIAVLALAETPALIGLLLEKLAGLHLPGPLSREDGTVRFAKALEVRPDLLFSCPGGAPLAVEVQGDQDDDKGRRWNVRMAVLHDGSGVIDRCGACRRCGRGCRPRRRGSRAGGGEGDAPASALAAERDLACGEDGAVRLAAARHAPSGGQRRRCRGDRPRLQEQARGRVAVAGRERDRTAGHVGAARGAPVDCVRAAGAGDTAWTPSRAASTEELPTLR